MKRKRLLAKFFGSGFQAQIIYRGCIIGGMNFFYNLFVIGISVNQWGSMSVFFGVPFFLAGRYIELFTYTVRTFLRVGDSRLRKAVADIMALLVCYVPLYVCVALLSGMTLLQTVHGVSFCISQTVLLGSLYGIILDYICNLKLRRRKRRMLKKKELQEVIRE